MQFENITETGRGASNMTSLRGYLPRMTGTQLREIFGAPERGCDKTSWEWVIRIRQPYTDKSLIATIYDYKVGGDDGGGLGMDEPYEWHVGGHDDRVVEALLAIIGEYLAVECAALRNQLSDVKADACFLARAVLDHQSEGVMRRAAELVTQQL